MSDDLGPGDVVEAVADSIGALGTIHKGDRATVASIIPKGFFLRCGWCGEERGGLTLVEVPVLAHRGWCPCLWRKIGGSEADTIARFAHHLIQNRQPETV